MSRRLGRENGAGPGGGGVHKTLAAQSHDNLNRKAVLAAQQCARLDGDGKPRSHALLETSESTSSVPLAFALLCSCSSTPSRVLYPGGDASARFMSRSSVYFHFPLPTYVSKDEIPQR
jgi:hypothetical protein